MLIFSPTHKRTEGRAPVWGSEFTSKRRALQGGSSRNRCRLNVKMCTSVTDCASGVIGKSTKFGFEWKWPLMGKK